MMMLIFLTQGSEEGERTSDVGGDAGILKYAFALAFIIFDLAASSVLQKSTTPKSV
jgi:hypothetical protein